MPIVPFSDSADSPWLDVLAEDGVVVLFKHSPSCGLSAIAYEEVSAFAAENPDVPVRLVDVLNQRSFSNAIESSLRIRHESPQTIVFRQGEPVWHGSHRKVTKVLLEAATR